MPPCFAPGTAGMMRHVQWRSDGLDVNSGATALVQNAQPDQKLRDFAGRALQSKVRRIYDVGLDLGTDFQNGSYTSPP